MDHVAFLASPALKGRRPMSRGSRRARKYIASQFRESGLRPWGNAGSFMQPVVMGTNVVGVVPGCDPALKGEIVLVTAHYDHLGKRHLGAADNAAGVAALLEIAKSLASAPPKRTVAFAAFDCEERGLWGSVSFSVRDDFDAARIAAVINIDMLGRKGFDVLENTLFMAASHAIPSVDETIAASGGIAVLPVPGYVASARSDHAVFETLGIPALFFSCGLFEDYHQEGDTLENLEPELLRGSTEAIARAVTAAANASALDARLLPQAGNDAMLASAVKVQSAVLAHPERFSISPELLDACRTLQADSVMHLEAPQCARAEHEDLLARGVSALGPIMMEYQYGIFEMADDGDGTEDDDRDSHFVSTQAAHYYLASRHHADFFANYRDYARTVAARSRLGLALKGLPHQHTVSNTLREDEFALEIDAEGNVWLTAIVPELIFTFHPRKVLRILPSGFAEIGLDVLYFEGTVQDLIDFLLIRWEHDFPFRQAEGIYARLLREVTGEEVGPVFSDWKRWRSEQLGIHYVQGWEPDAGEPTDEWKKEYGPYWEAWKHHLDESENLFVRHRSVWSPIPRFGGSPEEAFRLAGDPAAPAFARAAALDDYHILDQQTGTLHATYDMLEALATLVEDSTPAGSLEDYLLVSCDWDALPLVGPVMRDCLRQSLMNIRADKEPLPTIGALVHRRLETLSGEKNVTPSRAAWMNWLRAARTRDPEGALLPRLDEIAARHGTFRPAKPGGRPRFHYSGSWTSVLPIQANYGSVGNGYRHRFHGLNTFRFRPPGMPKYIVAGRRLP